MKYQLPSEDDYSLDIRTTPLNKRQQDQLLSLAREAINAHLKMEPHLPFEEEDPILLKRAGAFVTLRLKDVAEHSTGEQGSLRGCIGHIPQDRPLYLVVAQMAVEAATSDPRFKPLTQEELTNISIEISLLSILKPITSVEEIEIGKHGVLISGQGRRALLLPQVAPRLGWSREEFLTNLCRKAWLPPNYWRSDEVIIEIFTCQSFSDQD